MKLKFIRLTSLIASRILLIAFGTLTMAFSVALADDKASPSTEEKQNQEKRKASMPTSESEALGRARWMHESMHGALQVMHRDFFGDGDDGGGGSLVLPSQSLEDVFKEMARSWLVEIRWLGVNATLEEDHEPQDKFEEKAVEALKGGAEEFGEMEGDRFRFVGAITLHNQCLKCHVRNRTTMEDRIAGLAISMPVNTTSAK